MTHMKAEKHTFQTLDGLRGIAAIAVVIYHLPEVMGSLQMPLAYLAVDMFFLISGVVLAHAYSNRLTGGMTARQFMFARLVRLYPLYFAGTFISIVGISVGLAKGLSFEVWTLQKLGAASGPALFMLPSYAEGILNYYPLNGPTWSLMFELIVNLAFVMAFLKLSNRVLMTTIGISGALLASMAFAGLSLNIGSEWNNILGGLPRVFFSFPVGILIYRLFRQEKLPRIRMPIVAIIAMVIGTFSLNPSRANVPLFDLIAVLLVLPAIVWLAMCNEPTRGARMLSLLGTISYPIYMLHSSLFRVLRKVLEKLIGADYTLYAPGTGIALIMALIVISWCADRWYDRPIRKWLGKVTRGESYPSKRMKANAPKG